MKRLFVPFLAVLTSVSLMAVACSQPAAAPAPTKAAAPAVAPTKATEPTKAPAAAPTKAAEPTKAVAAAQPTAAPAKKVDFPGKGKTISLIVPYAAGGNVDAVARLLAPQMEKHLGVPIQIVNKPGASTQVGTTELVTSPADGYKVMLTGQATTALSYLDSQTKASYSRKDLQPVANAVTSALVLAVPTGSRFATTKDMIEAVKAKPESVKIGTSGLMSVGAFGGYALQEMAGVKFAFVDFTSGAESMTAMLGNHIDAVLAQPSVLLSHLRANTARALGVFDKKENKLVPGGKTMESQGYRIYSSSTLGMVVRAGTSKEIVGVLSAAVGRALQDPDVIKKIDDMASEVWYMDTAEYETYWKEEDAQLERLLAGLRKGQ